MVALDEKESGLRATLNLGHTFGHVSEGFMFDIVSFRVFRLEISTLSCASALLTKPYSIVFFWMMVY